MSFRYFWGYVVNRRRSGGYTPAPPETFRITAANGDYVTAADGDYITHSTED